MDRIEDFLNRLGYRLVTWQAGAVALIVSALVVVAAAALVHPVDGTEQLYAGSMPFGEGCAFYDQNGFGCMGCGMTRSWVYAVRGHVLTAFAYNAAGASLFYGIVLGAVLSAVRLVARAQLLRMSWPVMGGIGLGWGIALVGLFLLRWQGFFSLPTLN